MKINKTLINFQIFISQYNNNISQMVSQLQQFSEWIKVRNNSNYEKSRHPNKN
jgi:flagellar biosynthesis chaperone FliJ